VLALKRIFRIDNCVIGLVDEVCYPQNVANTQLSERASRGRVSEKFSVVLIKLLGRERDEMKKFVRIFTRSHLNRDEVNCFNYGAQLKIVL
jgi:hypothetical protein